MDSGLWKKEMRLHRKTGGLAGKEGSSVFLCCDFSLFFSTEQYTIERNVGGGL